VISLHQRDPVESISKFFKIEESFITVWSYYRPAGGPSWGW